MLGVPGSLEIGSAQLYFVGMYSQKRTASSAKGTAWINSAIRSKSSASLLPLIRHIRLTTLPSDQKPVGNHEHFKLGNLLGARCQPVEKFSRDVCHECFAQAAPTGSGSLLTLYALHLVLRRRQPPHVTRKSLRAKNDVWAEPLSFQNCDNHVKTGQHCSGEGMCMAVVMVLDCTYTTASNSTEHCSAYLMIEW